VTTQGEPDEAEPDYRMSMAAERTYLAYLRTGLALLAAGVAVAGALPDAGAEPLRRGLGLGLVAIGGTVTAAARWRWITIDRTMRRGEPMRPGRLALALGVVMIMVAIVAAVLVLVV
jgi:putative membrane protein